MGTKILPQKLAEQSPGRKAAAVAVLHGWGLNRVKAKER